MLLALPSCLITLKNAEAQTALHPIPSCSAMWTSQTAENSHSSTCIQKCLSYGLALSYGCKRKPEHGELNCCIQPTKVRTYIRVPKTHCPWAPKRLELHTLKFLFLRQRSSNWLLLQVSQERSVGFGSRTESRVAYKQLISFTVGAGI